MRPATALAIDCSNFTGYLSPETVEAWKSAGVRRVIVRASTERANSIAIARQQLAACQEASLELMAYLWCYWSEPLAAQVRAAELVLEDYPVKALALDCEDAVIWNPEEMVAKIQEGVNACTLPVMIYTSRYWWTRFTGNSDAFAYLPLWDCDLDGSELGGFESYGGWQQRATRQYQFDATMGGVQVDLSVYQLEAANA